MPNSPPDTFNYRSESDNYTKIVLQQLELNQKSLEALRSDTAEADQRIIDLHNQAFNTLMTLVNGNNLVNESRLTKLETQSDGQASNRGEGKWWVSVIFSIFAALFTILTFLLSIFKK